MKPLDNARQEAGKGGALNPRQEAFVREYLVDLNATQAAIRAGYSRTTAEQQGHRLLSHVGVAAALRKAKTDRSERTQVTADWLLSRLAEEAEADIADIYAEDGSLRPVAEWPPIWRKGLVQGIDVEEIRADGAVMGIVRKVKISDRVKRLELIGRHIDVGAFRDRIEHTGKDGGPVQVETKVVIVPAKAPASVTVRAADADAGG